MVGLALLPAYSRAPRRYAPLRGPRYARPATRQPYARRASAPSASRRNRLASSPTLELSFGCRRAEAKRRPCRSRRRRPLASTSSYRVSSVRDLIDERLMRLGLGVCARLRGATHP